MEVEERKIVNKFSKEEFAEELSKIKPDLPKNYGVIISHLYPSINKRTVYNVVNYGIHNEEILTMLKFVVPSKN